MRCIKACIMYTPVHERTGYGGFQALGKHRDFRHLRICVSAHFLQLHTVHKQQCRQACFDGGTTAGSEDVCYERGIMTMTSTDALTTQGVSLTRCY